MRLSCLVDLRERGSIDIAEGERDGSVGGSVYEVEGEDKQGVVDGSEGVWVLCEQRPSTRQGVVVVMTGCC